MARHGHQPQPGARPNTPPSGGSSGVLPAATKPSPAPIAKPALTGAVLVKTTGSIRGRTEHAAMITGVASDSEIDVTIFPAGEPSYPVQSVHHVDSPGAGAITWRWPPRD